MPEQWKQAVGFEGYYEISDLGNARRVGKSKALSRVVNKDGYIAYCFCVNAKRTNVLAHKLVLDAFKGPCPVGQVARHNDGSRTNNVPSNLDYGTPKQNSEDMVAHDTQCKGEESHLSKLTEDDVRAIRASTKSQNEIASEYGIAASNVSFIQHHITWKHVKGTF